MRTSRELDANDVVLYVLFLLGILQRPVRTRVASISNGPIWGYDSSDFHRALDVHGGSRHRRLGGRRFHPAVRKPPALPSAKALRAERTPDWIFRAIGARTIAVGTPSYSEYRTEHSDVIKQLLHGFRRVDRCDPGAVVRLHGRYHSSGDVRDQKRHRV